MHLSKAGYFLLNFSLDSAFPVYMKQNSEIFLAHQNNQLNQWVNCTVPFKQKKIGSCLCAKKSQMYLSKNTKCPSVSNKQKSFLNYQYNRGNDTYNYSVYVALPFIFWHIRNLFNTCSQAYNSWNALLRPCCLPPENSLTLCVLAVAHFLKRSRNPKKASCLFYFCFMTFDCMQLWALFKLGGLWWTRSTILFEKYQNNQIVHIL